MSHIYIYAVVSHSFTITISLSVSPKQVTLTCNNTCVIKNMTITTNIINQDTKRQCTLPSCNAKMMHFWLSCPATLHTADLGCAEVWMACTAPTSARS